MHRTEFYKEKKILSHHSNFWTNNQVTEYITQPTKILKLTITTPHEYLNKKSRASDQIIHWTTRTNNHVTEYSIHMMWKSRTSTAPLITIGQIDGTAQNMKWFMYTRLILSCWAILKKSRAVRKKYECKGETRKKENNRPPTHPSTSSSNSNSPLPPPTHPPTHTPKTERGKYEAAV